ncbi:MAG: hypothetical protein KatS3mg096_566 [Candidatus Parcubacteria bacterium]|nr:MAG: hypothetical protein KatS3mg095_0954 [Candidatus Parcubacteria bacterium]GIW67698.1 MAG: hypothetical protein KatS3mg096_566 [Candidatus Parcubacteria bacterium]
MGNNFEVYFTPSAKDDLLRLLPNLQKKILKKIYWLKDNLTKIKLTLLTGNFSGFFKLRLGDYRVLYKLDYENKKIIIYVIKHRKDVYR